MKNVLVILSAWKRESYFKEQIEAITRQKNVNIVKILLWQNENHINIDWLRDYGVEIIKSDVNIKFHARFTLPLLFDNIDYTAIFDDDTIPGDGWIENAIRCVDEHNCIAGQNGRIYRWNDKKFDGIGDNGFNQEDTKVDLVGHSWVFKTEMIRDLWSQKQVSYETGEDMQFCLSALYHSNIDSYCVKQTNSYDTGSLKPNYSGDNNASFRILGDRHHSLRSEICEHWLNKIKEK